jgi:Family of unknown function (DUF6093)
VSSDPVLDGALADGRAAHEGLMVDACTITRPGTPTLNRSTSALTPGTATQLYSGKCRIKPQRTPTPTEAGEKRAIVARYEFALPFSAVPSQPLQPGDVVTLTTSADPRLVGQVMTVMALDYGSTATAWRITLEDQN